MSCTSTAARSTAAPLTAILNLRGSHSNSGCKVDHCRIAHNKVAGPQSRRLRTSKVICGDVADATAAGLYGVHVDLGQLLRMSGTSAILAS